MVDSFRKVGFSILIALFFTSFSIHAQNILPQNYFSNPLNIPISLAGTFGEIRTDHYHTGIDIRTDGREGLAVHAVAKGYVSRIVVSPYGYGNALYVTHPNGYITLYGHLSRFNNAIAAFVKSRQYSEEEYRQDIFLKSGQFDVNQGDTIAFSGSTGAAEGPHLHFEIRDGKTEDPINPLLAGYPVPDTLPPIIEGIAIYPLNDSSSVNGKHQPLYIRAKKTRNHYLLTSDSDIHALGSIGVGISCYDIAEGTVNHNGAYIKLLKDNSDTIYCSRMDVLNFATMRYINGHIDYAGMHNRIDTIEYSFLQDNDRLNIYKKLVDKGRIRFKPLSNHHLVYSICDFNGNTSTLFFNIDGERKTPPVYQDTTKYVAIANWRLPFSYSGKGMKIEIPAADLFNTIHFHYGIDSSKDNNVISPVYRIQNEDVPLFASYTLKLKPGVDLPDSIMKKAVVVRVSGNQRASIGGAWADGYMTVHPRSFGNYVIMLDLYRPIIKPLNIFKGKNMSRDKEIAFEISDNLSGVRSFRCTIDGKWVLMEFNPKKSCIYYTFDEHVGKGLHQLKLVVSDEVGNTTYYNTDFTR